ncbi:mitochondrial PGP phosphatase [Glomus cerebriforme]|uniref:Mitochondrial PGP phosphatase n=1 Tax=Glomus cerebriforme TaxID=658196 RepID=A0A397TFS4_9GLOM|nr:mitochondrial PGP phosphatase [Glomus cerebriforme]
MVQSLNLNAIISSIKVFRKAHLCIPHLIVNDIRNINFYKLKSIGINALAFDKDNTLTAPYSNEIYPPFKSAWEESKKVFGNENITIVSNSPGTGDDPGFIQAGKIEKSLGVYVLRHQSKKPSCGQELTSHFAAYNPHTIAVIGDRMFTDVLFGNLNGMFTIFTRKIISEKRDNFMAAMVHFYFFVKQLSSFAYSQND